MPLTLVASPRFVDHVTPVGHPERPERAQVFNRVASEFAKQGGRVLDPRTATDADLERVHTREP
jgi:acetoin utilization deacetylase AcuC-like enzyme